MLVDLKVKYLFKAEKKALSITLRLEKQRKLSVLHTAIIKLFRRQDYNC